MITLYGGAMTRGGRCIITLEECGLDYELRDLSLTKGEHKDPKYMKLNPNGRLPCLVDGEFVLWESMAINVYLAVKYGKGLMPDSVEGRAQVLQWSFWAITTLEPPLAELFNQRIMLSESDRSEETIRAETAKVEEGLAVLEHHLEGKDYVLGDAFTLADIHCGYMIAWAGFVGVDLSRFERILGWTGRIQERPSFQKLQQLQATAAT